MDLVRAVRDVRTQMDVPNSRKSKLIIVSQDAGIREIFAQNQTTYAGLANASEVCVQADESGIGSDAVSAVIPDAVIYMPLADLVDLTKEKERLTREQKRLEGELKRSHGMLSNERFLSNAPADKVAAERDKLAKYEQMMADVTARLKSIAEGLSV